MKVLFAVNNEKVSTAIIKKYQMMYKEIISCKNVYFFNAIIKELQKDKSYDRIVIGEDLEPYANNNYEVIDNFLFDKLDSISDEASNSRDGDIPIILIGADRREKGSAILVKLFGIGIYNVLLGQDRSIENVCKLIAQPRTKKEAKAYYRIEAEDVDYQLVDPDSVSETEIQNIIKHYRKLGKNEEASELVDNDLKESNMILGKTDVYGEGVTITLSNSDEREVKYRDLIELINELRYAGAEAISINDVRVISSTYIAQPDGVLILVNGQRISSPYVIKAIGNQTYLSSTLSLRDSGYIDKARAVGLNIKLETGKNIKILKYSGDMNIKYMKEGVIE